MVASLHFVHRRHDLKTLSPEDQVQEIKNQQDVDPLSNDEFRAGMVELARDLITKEQEIEARDLVPGDILVLEEGNTIAADAKAGS